MLRSGELRKIRLKPGINRNDTTYQALNEFVDGDKIRFVDGMVEKLGGWQKVPDGGFPFAGVARESIIWSDLASNRYYALGTTEGIYIYSGGLYYDITPVIRQKTETSAFYTYADSLQVKVSDASHGSVAGDSVVISDATNGAGVSLNGRYTITSATNNTYTFNAATSSASTRTKKGKATTFNYLLEAGKVDNDNIVGYGASTFGTGTYGTSYSSDIGLNMRLWSLDNWGEDLLAVPKQGGLYYWKESDGLAVRASIVNGAPTYSNYMFVADDSRQVVLCGTSAYGGDFDPMLLRWSDIEDYTDWTPSSTNASGQLRLNGGSYIAGYCKSRKETLVFTDECAFSFKYKGAPFYFTADKLADASGIVGPNAAIAINGVVYWWGKNAFFRYDGALSKIPCKLSKAIFETESDISLNYNQKEKIYAGFNSEHNEIWWFYPTKDSQENDRYVVYNIKDDIFYDGSMGRTTWAESILFDTPIATGTSAVSYFHEVGYDADGAPLRSFAKTGFFEIADGNEIVFASRFVPDFKDLTGNNLKLRLGFKKYPSAEESFKGPYSITPQTQKINLRARGRQMSLQFDVSALGSYYKMGDNRIEVTPDGER